MGSLGGLPTYAPPPVKNPRPLEPAFSIDGVDFVVGLVSQWTKGPPDGAGSFRINNDTWMVIESRDGAHPVAAELFGALTGDGSNEASEFMTSDRKTWSFWFSGGGHVISNADALRKWIESYPGVVMTSEDPWRVWTTEHVKELRGPIPSKGAIWKLPKSKEGYYA